jgi:hypothetical protein
MNQDDFDMDLERRLRSIGRAAPEAPSTLDDVAREVILRGRSRTAARFDGRIRPHALRGLSGLAAVLAVVALVGGLLRTSTSPAAQQWTPRPDAGSGEWTAIEWHDVSSGFAGMNASRPLWTALGEVLPIHWSHGYALVGDQARWWLSQDGLDWRLATNIPQDAWVASVGGQLLVLNGLPGTGAWLTTDGEKLTPVAVPFDLGRVSGVVSGKPGLVVTTSPAADPSQPEPAGPTTVYVTRDGVGWIRAVLPSDLAQARGVSVRAFIDGFMATGEIEDPNGSSERTSQSGGGPTLTWRYSEYAWYSPDGLTWSKYDPQGYSLPPFGWAMMVDGRLGATNGDIHSTDGGQSWSKDTNAPPSPQSPNGRAQMVSDGNRILYAVDGGGRFYLSEGDGHWTLLNEGGDVGNLPSDGEMLIEPKGILWISGNKVYFGEGLSGVEPKGSIGPPVSPSPDPNATPTSTPAIEATPAATGP